MADRPDIGVITTPGWAAQGVADLLVRAGVTSLLNFAPRVLNVPAAVNLRYVDLSIELQVLGFYRARDGEPGRDAERGPDDARGGALAGPRAGLTVRGPAGDWQAKGRDRHNCVPTQEGTECPSSS